MKELKFVSSDKQIIIQSLKTMLEDAERGEIDSFLWAVRRPERVWDWGMNGISNRFEVAGHLMSLANIVLHSEKLGE